MGGASRVWADHTVGDTLSPRGLPQRLVWGVCWGLWSPALCWQVISKEHSWKCNPGISALLGTQHPDSRGTSSSRRDYDLGKNIRVMAVGRGSELAEDQGLNPASQLCQAAAGLNSPGAQMALGQRRWCPWFCSAVSSLARQPPSSCHQYGLNVCDSQVLC